MKKNHIAGLCSILLLSLSILCGTQTPAEVLAASNTGQQVVVRAEITDGDAAAQKLQLSIKTYHKIYKTDSGRVYKELKYEYPQAAGSSDAAKRFNKYYKKLLKEWKTENQKALSGEASDVESLPEDDGRYYSDQVTCKITSQDGGYISILQQGYEYTLGAHGMPYRIARVFDAKTGKQVKATTILGLTKKQVNKKVAKLYMKKYDKTVDTEDFQFYADRDLVSDALNKTDFVTNNSCYVKNGKLRFFTYPYEIGPYAAGFVEVAIKL